MTDTTTALLARAREWLKVATEGPDRLAVSYQTAPLHRSDIAALCDALEEAQQANTELRAERDKAREDCGHQKAMREHLRGELDRFIKLKMQAEAEIERLTKALDEAQLASIEARNPGIDTDEVRRMRAGRKKL